MSSVGLEGIGGMESTMHVVLATRAVVCCANMCVAVCKYWCMAWGGMLILMSHCFQHG